MARPVSRAEPPAAAAPQELPAGWIAWDDATHIEYEENQLITYNP